MPISDELMRILFYFGVAGLITWTSIYAMREMPMTYRFKPYNKPKQYKYDSNGNRYRYYIGTAEVDPEQIRLADYKIVYDDEQCSAFLKEKDFGNWESRVIKLSCIFLFFATIWRYLCIYELDYTGDWIYKVDHACFVACLIILFCVVRVSDKIFLKAMLEADAEINKENEV